MKKTIKFSIFSLLVIPSIFLISSCNSAQNPYEYKENNGTVAYLATFNSHGGSPVDSQHYSVINEMPNSTKEGHSLRGWYTDVEDNLISFPYTLTKDTLFHASWSVNTYTCSFQTNGGSNVDPISNVLTVEESPITTREGYEFVGWHLKEDLSDTIVSFPLALSNDITLYAEWLKEEITPKGTLLAVAKVDAMEAKSYWSFEYEEEYLRIHAEVSDQFLYGYYDNPGYNDNVEVVLCPKNRDLPAGYVVNNTHHFLSDYNGNGYYNIANTIYSLSANSSLPSNCQITARKCTLEKDGFKGFVVDFCVSYSLFKLTREEAVNNITMTVAMRNTNSYTATYWGGPLYNDYLSCWSYSLLKEDGTIENTDINASSIIVGGSNFAIRNQSNMNASFASTNTYIYSKEGELEEWQDEAKGVSLYSADKLILNIGRYDYYISKLTNDEIVSSVIEFAKYYISTFGASHIYITSIEPLLDLSTNLATLQSINTNIKNQCLSNGFNYIDTYSLFVDGSTIKTSYYKDNFVFSEAGITAYYDLIKTYL